MTKGMAKGVDNYCLLNVDNLFARAQIPVGNTCFVYVITETDSKLCSNSKCV